MTRELVRAFIWDEEGVTSSEYAVMLVLIVCAVIASVTAVGNSTAQGWTNNVNKVVTACNNGS